jgi:hypothetical protein
MGNMVPVDIPAGVRNTASKAKNSSNWREVHMIRWEGDTISPIGGWVPLKTIVFASPVRKIHRWLTNGGITYTAYLCEKHCYVSIEDSFIDITPTGGITPPSGNAGYGDFKYSYSHYGTPRTGRPPRTKGYGEIYSLDNWGDQLRVMWSYDGRLLGWDPAAAAGTLLTARPNAPTNNRFFLITPERHIMLFGMGGKTDKFGWCDQEDDTDWLFTDVNSKAGYYDLEPTTPIVTAELFFGGIYMAGVHNNYHIKSVGLPYVYSYEQIADAPLPLGSHSIIRVPEGVIWASNDGYWIYDGTRTGMVPCLIWDWVKQYIDVQACINNAFMVNLTNKSEAWWFFADASGKNVRAAILDYRRNVWSMAKLSRTCALSYGSDPHPIMSDGTKVYIHENGWSYLPESLPWAETFTINVNSGDNWSTFHQMRPELVAADRDCLSFTLYKKMDRSSPVETTSPPRYVTGDGFVDFRETSRDFRLRVQMMEEDPWTVGPFLMDVKKRGKK